MIYIVLEVAFRLFATLMCITFFGLCLAGTYNSKVQRRVFFKGWDDDSPLKLGTAAFLMLLIVTCIEANLLRSVWYMTIALVVGVVPPTVMFSKELAVELIIEPLHDLRKLISKEKTKVLMDREADRWDGKGEEV